MIWHHSSHLTNNGYAEVQMYNKSRLMTQFCDVVFSQQSLPRARLESSVSHMGIEHDDLDKLL